MWHRGGIDCNAINVDAADSVHQETSQCKTTSGHYFMNFAIQISQSDSWIS